MQANIETNKGTIKLKLFYDQAPITVSNFVNLSNRGYYNNLNYCNNLEEFGFNDWFLPNLDQLSYL